MHLYYNITLFLKLSQKIYTSSQLLYYNNFLSQTTHLSSVFAFAVVFSSQTVHFSLTSFVDVTNFLSSQSPHLLQQFPIDDMTANPAAKDSADGQIKTTHTDTNKTT